MTSSGCSASIRTARPTRPRRCATSGWSRTSRSPSTGSGPPSIGRRAWRLRTTGSCWGGRTWRPSRAISPRRPGGSTPASAAARAIRRSGAPGSAGPSGPTGPDEVRRALAQLPGGELDPAEVLELRAWFAGRRGDRRAERIALERWLELAPDEPRAMDRLADLAILEGGPDRAAELRRRKVETEGPRTRYRERLARPQYAASAEELARLAEAMGAIFEARGWWLVAMRRAPGRLGPREELTRLSAKQAPRTPAGATPASLLADLAKADAPGRSIEVAQGARPDFRDDAEAAGLRFPYDNGQTAPATAPRDDGRGRRPARLRRRRLARRLLPSRGGRSRPGPRSPAHERRSPLPQPGRRHLRGRHRAGRASPRCPAATATAWRSATIDNDGHPDLFVTRWRSYALYRNRGDGTFEDVTEAAGPGGRPRLADLGGLRRPRRRRRPRPLRLPLPRLGRRAPAALRSPDGLGTATTYCDPGSFDALPDHLFRNDGGRFVDVTAEAGIVDRDGRGLGVVAADLDDDGRVDLYVANDTTANFLFRNLGGLRFEEVGARRRAWPATPTAGYQAGMGVACGDLDGDGRPDLAVTNFYGESTTLYRNLGGRPLRRPDRRRRPGRPEPVPPRLRRSPSSTPTTTAGSTWPTANGHVNDFRPDHPLRDARPAPGRRRGGPPDRRLRPRRAPLEGPAGRPGAGRRRPRQRRPASTS